MSESRSRRWSRGFTLVEVVAVTGIMSALYSGGNYHYAITQANEVKGISNLRQVYIMLVAQSLTDGLPKAAFYPKGDPRKDPASIVKLLQGAPAELFISPFAPDGLKQKGLTFAWNDTVNGRELDQLPRGTWLLIDLAAFIADPKIPKPERYFMLYADGRCASVKTLPPDIQKVVKEAEAKLREPKEKKPAD